MDNIQQWLQSGGELFVVQEGEGGHKIMTAEDLTKLIRPKHGDGLAEAIIIKKGDKSIKSTANEIDLENLENEIQRMIIAFDTPEK